MQTNDPVFEDVKKIEAAGYSSVNKTYSFTDANPYKGVSYYRIKQYDLNGRYFYSHLVAAEFLEQNSVAIQTDNIKPENIISILGNKKYY